ncbi:MAG: SSU ribosomal protein S7P [halophilic archaeon J07HX64]|jgi:SSU ribosomal protein S7P|nr:MAG: SSU ribosomal protein S7P [halophilic archaeon J07HX64]
MSTDQPDPDAPGEEDSSARLFEQWPVTNIEFRDPSTERYITVTPVAHTLGRHANKQFKKSQISIVERLINRLMQTDENTGKKQLTTRITREAFDIIHSRTDENPVQVLVRAVENSAPREETVRLKYGGISVPKAVDVSPQRRVDQALMFIAQGVHRSTFKSETDAAEALASQLIGGSNNDVNTYSVEQKEEKERVAAAAR